MTPLELLTHPLAQRLTWTLAHFVWQGFLIAVVLALVVEVLRIRSANTRYGLSLGALLLMLVVVPFTWFAIGDQSERVALSQPVLMERIDVILIEGDSATAPTTNWWLALQPFLLVAWFAGCVLLNLRLVIGWLATHQLLHSRQLLPREVTARLAILGWRFQLSISSVVFASEQVSQALAVGFFRPVVLLPTAWLLEMPPHLLEAVVAHELAHLRRCDLWVNLLQRVAEAVLFYHPAIWWLSARLRRERELCCDQLAVEATGQRLEYAEALELTARWAAVDGRPALAAGFFGEGKMNLLHRVRCVLGISNERPASLWPAGLLLGGLSLALLAAIYGANSSTVNADDERPGAKEGERREGEVRRDGDKPAASEADRFLGRAQAEPRRDGDRPREGEVRRDGDRPRPDAPRDGERRPDVKRPDQPREGAPREGAPRDGEVRRPAATGENAELMAIIKQLRAEVGELRAEVARLRGGAARKPGEGDLRIEPRREGDRPRVEGGDRPKTGGDRPRPEAGRREGGDQPRPEGVRREGGDRPRAEGERREGGDKPKAEGDRR
jgi:beta-lactamase regulating signal transducer with metallopeptidase domain